MTRVVVSVITGAYNCSEYIGEAYDSLRHQTFSDWEWVVVDDASIDVAFSGHKNQSSPTPVQNACIDLHIFRR